MKKQLPDLLPMAESLVGKTLHFTYFNGEKKDFELKGIYRCFISVCNFYIANICGDWYPGFRLSRESVIALAESGKFKNKYCEIILE